MQTYRHGIIEAKRERKEEAIEVLKELAGDRFNEIYNNQKIVEAWYHNGFELWATIDDFSGELLAWDRDSFISIEEEELLNALK